MITEFGLSLLVLDLAPQYNSISNLSFEYQVDANPILNFDDEPPYHVDPQTPCRIVGVVKPEDMWAEDGEPIIGYKQWCVYADPIDRPGVRYFFFIDGVEVGDLTEIAA